MTALDYDAACAAATTAQGLDPVLTRLREEGVADVGLEQTGGFCMVVTVTRNTRVYAVTRDGEDPERPYLFGTYTRDAWRNGGEELRYDADLSLDDIVHRLTKDRRYAANYSGRRGPKRGAR